jgi:hypothetical protein
MRPCWALLAEIWALVASVARSLGPTLGPAGRSIFVTVYPEAQGRCAMSEPDCLILDC